MAGFLKKNWQKDATKNIIGVGCEIGGAFAGAWISKKITEKSTSDTVKNIINPALMAVSTLGALMIDNEYLNNACRGMATITALKALAVIAPDTVGQTIGLQGIEEDAVLMSGIATIGDVAALPETTEQYTGDELQELTDAGTTQSDGNDWNAVADQIDYDQTIEQQVNGVEGVDDDDTATMMGLGDAEDTANLMGMF